MREMKDSGIEWIVEIPNSWTVRRGKTLFVNTKYIPGKLSSNYDRLSLTLKGVLPRKKDDSDGLQPKDFDTYQLLRENELVFKLIDLQNVSTSRVGLAHATGLVSPAYIVLHANKEILPAFAEKFYLMMWYREIFNSLGDNGVRSSLNVSDLLNIPVCYPKMEEQIFLTNFLDTQCSEIDATAEDIRKEISLLEDYKKSVITEAMTKGLNPDAEMKDSGIAWIGDIPKDWDLLKIGYVTKEISDIDHYMPSDSDDIDKVPYLMIGDLKENISQIDFESCKYISKKVYRALSIKSKPEKGNVIFARYATIGTVCFVDSEKQLLVSYACLTVKANELIKGRFLFYYFKSNAFLEEVSQYVKSNTQGNIGKESLIRAKIVVPKLKEQTQIISYLDSKCSEIDAIIADKKRQRCILAEYKKSLIYEYVTGKKEVPVHE